MLTTQCFAWINENTWKHLCYPIFLQISKYLGMKHVTFEFRNKLDNINSGSVDRSHFDRKGFQS